MFEPLILSVKPAAPDILQTANVLLPMTTLRPDVTLDFLRNRQRGCLPELLGIELVSLDSGALVGELTDPAPRFSLRTASCTRPA